MLAPIIAHFVGRRAPRRIVFPSVRFLDDGVAARSSRIRWRDLALLGVRCAIVFLLVGAFAQPVWRTAASSARDGMPAGGMSAIGRDLVIVLDASASMRIHDRGVSRFDRAKSRALDLLESLAPGVDRAAVIVGRREATALLPGVTSNIPALRAALADTGVTFERASMNDALQLAQSLFEIRPERDRAGQIVLLTDAQASAFVLPWPDSSNLRCEWFGADDSATPNLAVSELRVNPKRPVVGDEIDIVLEVANFTPVRREVLVSVEALDDSNEVVAADRLTLEAWSTGAAHFAVTPVSRGLSRYRAALTDTGPFDADNGVEFGIVAHPSSRYALISSGIDARDGEGRFYAAALASAPAGSTVEMLDALDTNPAWPIYDGFVITQCDAMSFEVRAALAERLRRGARAWWAIDSTTGAQALDAFLTTAGLPPAQWKTTTERDDESYWITSDESAVSWDDELRFFFERSLVSTQPGRVGVPILDAETGGRAIIADSNDLPLLTSRSIGDGKLFVFLGTIAPPDSMLASSPAFPVLLHTVFHSTQGASAESFHPGSPIEFMIDQRLDLDAIAVRPSVVELSITPGQSVFHIQASGAAEPGLYELIDADTNETIATRTVSIDQAESDLRPLAPEVRDRLVGEAAASSATQASRFDSDSPIRIWPALLLSTLALCAIESLLTMRRGRADTEGAR